MLAGMSETEHVDGNSGDDATEVSAASDNGAGNARDFDSSEGQSRLAEAQAPASADSSQEHETGGTAFESLSASYERLRHSADSAELSQAAHEPLPDRSDQAAFSRETALLEAVAGNEHTPLEDRVFLASTMPFPNILVKLSQDPNVEVRRAVAENKDDKNWLVGQLTKDEDAGVREAALRNPQTSWKMRLEGAEDSRTSADTLDFLSKMGVENDGKSPEVLAAMVRRAVALNPNCSQTTLERLAVDESLDVRHAAASRRVQ
jgi:hypothetical protein